MAYGYDQRKVTGLRYRDCSHYADNFCFMLPAPEALHTLESEKAEANEQRPSELSYSHHPI